MERAQSREGGGGEPKGRPPVGQKPGRAKKTPGLEKKKPKPTLPGITTLVRR